MKTLLLIMHKFVKVIITDILYCIWTLGSSPRQVGLFQEVQQHAEINWQRIWNVKDSTSKEKYWFKV